MNCTPVHRERRYPRQLGTPGKERRSAQRAPESQGQGRSEIIFPHTTSLEMTTRGDPSKWYLIHWPSWARSVCRSRYGNKCLHLSVYKITAIDLWLLPVPVCVHDTGSEVAVDVLEADAFLAGGAGHTLCWHWSIFEIKIGFLVYGFLTYWDS